jgi:hypothetical protein
MCPTTLGRVQTRTVILIGPAILGLLLSLASGSPGFIVLIGLYLLLGVALDTAFYSWVIRWQPPWLTGVLGLGEFILLYLLAKLVRVPIDSFDAIWFYWLSWAMAIATKIVVLPIVSLSWIENGGELRTTGWSVPPNMEPVAAPAGSAQEAAAGPPAVAAQFSAVAEVPAELRDLPAPSGVHRVPEGLGSG